MSRGRRYESKKLNMKKVFAVIVAIVVIIMFVFIIKGILSRDKEQGKISSKDYLVVYKDNKWGVIDSDSTTVIEPSYEEMITIPNSKKDVFLCIYDVNYETGEYKTKALNSKNEEIFNGYEQIEAIEKRDESNNLWYEKDVLKVKQGDKYGIIDMEGKELLQCEYDDIASIGETDNALKILKDGKYGVVNNTGKEVLDIQYLDITNLGKDNKLGFIVKGENNKFGIVDYFNKTILETKYDAIEKVYGNDYYVVIQNNKQILIDKNGTEVLTQGFDEIKAIMKNATNGVICTNRGNYGIINSSGENIVSFDYQDLKEAKSGILIAKQNDKYGIIDLEKNIKVEFKYNSITYNEKADIYIAEDESYNNDILDNNFGVKQTGYLIQLDDEKGYFELRQQDEYKYYNFKFEEKNANEIHQTNTLYVSKQDGKYGYIDKEGKVVVDYQYDDAIEQNQYGYCAVKKDGKWGSLDNKGNVVQEPTYDLEEYLKVDFIGRWHLGKDINMNYYNQL